MAEDPIKDPIPLIDWLILAFVVTVVVLLGIDLVRNLLAAV